MSNRLPSDRNQKSLDPRKAGENQRTGAGTNNPTGTASGSSAIPRLNRHGIRIRDRDAESLVATTRNIVERIGHGSTGGGSLNSRAPTATAARPPVPTTTGAASGSRKRPGTVTGPSASPRHFPNASPPHFGHTIHGHPVSHGSGRTRLNRTGAGGSVGKRSIGERGTNSVNVILSPNGVSSLTGSVMDSQMFPSGTINVALALPPKPKPMNNSTYNYNIEITNDQNSDTMASLYGKVVGKTDLGGTAEPVEKDPAKETNSANIPKSDSQQKDVRIVEKAGEEKEEDGFINNDSDQLAQLYQQLNAIGPKSPDVTQALALIELENTPEDVIIKEIQDSFPAVQPGSKDLNSDNSNQDRNQETILPSDSPNWLRRRQKQQIADIVSIAEVKRATAINANELEEIQIKTLETVGATPHKTVPGIEEKEAQRLDVSVTEEPATPTIVKKEKRQSSLSLKISTVAAVEEEEAQVKEQEPTPTKVVSVSEPPQELPEEETIEATLPPAILSQEIADDVDFPDELDLNSVTIPTGTRQTVPAQSAGALPISVPAPVPETETEQETSPSPARTTELDHNLDNAISFSSATSGFIPSLAPATLDFSATPSTTVSLPITPGNVVTNLGNLVSAPALLLSGTERTNQNHPPTAPESPPVNGVKSPDSNQVPWTQNKVAAKEVTGQQKAQPQALSPKLQETSLDLPASLPQTVNSDLLNTPLSTEIDLLASVHPNPKPHSHKTKSIPPALVGKLRQSENVSEIELLQAVNRVNSENKNAQASGESNQDQILNLESVPSRMTPHTPGGSRIIRGISIKRQKGNTNTNETSHNKS